MTATGRMVGNLTDMLSVTAWITDLGLTCEEIVEVIAATAKGRAPVGAFRYFNEPMQKHAAMKAASKLRPSEHRVPLHNRLHPRSARPAP
jgi:hypothetical protein